MLCFPIVLAFFLCSINSSQNGISISRTKRIEETKRKEEKKKRRKEEKKKRKGDGLGARVSIKNIRKVGKKESNRRAYISKKNRTNQSKTTVFSWLDIFQPNQGEAVVGGWKKWECDYLLLWPTCSFFLLFFSFSFSCHFSLNTNTIIKFILSTPRVVFSQPNPFLFFSFLFGFPFFPPKRQKNNNKVQ